MESYGEWKVAVYDAIFGESRFLDSPTVWLSELDRKPNLVELAVTGNSPNC